MVGVVWQVPWVAGRQAWAEWEPTSGNAHPPCLGNGDLPSTPTHVSCSVPTCLPSFCHAALNTIHPMPTKYQPPSTTVRMPTNHQLRQKPNKQRRERNRNERFASRQTHTHVTQSNTNEPTSNELMHAYKTKWSVYMTGELDLQRVHSRQQQTRPENNT